MGFRERRNLKLNLLVLPAMLMVGVYLYYPILDNLYISLLDVKNFNFDSAVFCGLQNYIGLFTNDLFYWPAFKNTAVITAGTIFIQLPIAFLLANFLANHVKPKFNRIEIWLLLLLFIPILLPTPVYARTWQHIFTHELSSNATPNAAFERIVYLLNLEEQVKKLFGINTTHLLGEIKTAFWVIFGVQTWARVGFNLLIYRTAILSIPKDLYESAEIDGANAWGKLFYITIPICKEVIGATITLAILGVFQLFDVVWLMTEGGPLNSTHLLATYMYKRSFIDLRAGYGAAIASTILISALIFTLLQRWLMRSRTSVAGM